jgi:hypothetical protein
MKCNTMLFILMQNPLQIKCEYYTILNEISPMIEGSYSLKFVETPPTVFRNGDIVEVQMTVAMVPVPGAAFKVVFQLRSLALVNSIFAQVCHRKI